MNKLFTTLCLATAALAPLAAAPTGGAPAAKSITEAAPKTQADSISYYFGTQISEYYDSMCEDDPSLKTPGAKQEFLKAFNDAISQLEDKTNAYITGYNAGVQVLLKGVQLDKYFDIHLNPGMVGYGIAYALSDNTDRTKIQSEGMQYLDNIFSAEPNIYYAKEQEAETPEPHPSLAKYNAAFFSKPGNYKTTPSGLQYVIIKEGNGESPKATSNVTVNYEGMLLDGTVFDSSFERGEPIDFPLDKVIPGWTEGLQLMKPGGEAVFYIPYKLAYGESGTPGGPIPAKADLIFLVHLISVNN
jgi:FKBP-type peptidyl-prolyl cis-trans isomerase